MTLWPGRVGTGIPQRRLPGTGLDLSAISLGLWQNFGSTTPFENQRRLVWYALDRGVTHLDLANNYGPPAGAAEQSVGRMLRALPRDEIVISTKAGFRAGSGPYKEGGSRKYLLSSLDATLNRLGLGYVDIFYSHRFDATTPLAETIGALATAVRSGRALYAGISNYSAERTRQAQAAAAEAGILLVVHQASYSMINRWIEEPAPGQHESLLDVVGSTQMGLVAFSPLAQGMLTDRYLTAVPADSRAAGNASLKRSFLTEQNLGYIRRLSALAAQRGQSLSQLALAWVLRDPRITAVTVGARTTAQLDQNLEALRSPALTADELQVVTQIPADTGINIWAARSSNL